MVPCTGLSQIREKSGIFQTNIKSLKSEDFVLGQVTKGQATVWEFCWLAMLVFMYNIRILILTIYTNIP